MAAYRAINRCLLYVLSLVLLSTGLLIGYSGNAAAQQSDDWLQFTDNIRLINSDASCNLDFTHNWQTLITHSDNQAMANSFQDAIDHPDGKWIVRQNEIYRNDPNLFNTSIIIQWTTNPDTHIGYSEINGEYYMNLIAPSNDRPNNVVIQLGQDCEDFSEYYRENSGQNLGIGSTANPTSYPKILLSTFPTEYPPDYNGPEIPDILDDAINNQRIIVLYTVHDKTIQGSVIGPDQKGFIGDQWTKAEVKITDQQDNELYKHVNNDDGVTFEYTFDDYGNYKMHVRVYNLPPLTPSDIKPIVIDPLVINGSTYNTSSMRLDCDQDGTCSGITDGNTSAVQRRLNEFEADMHGIEAIVYEPIKFIATLPAKVGNCTGLNLNLFNRNISIPCGYQALQNSQPTLAAYMAIFMNGIVALLLGYKLFSFIRGMQDPKDDRIEVVRL